MPNPSPDAPLEKVPRHVAIIMDGNGRWALSRGLPRLAGHKAGTENLRRIIRASVEFGVKYLTIYAFSTENWGRPPEEVRGLMNILEDVIDRELGELHKEGVQLRHIGRLERLAPTLQEKVLDAVEVTKNNDRLILNIAFNYGGRDEIVQAIQHMMKDGVSPDKVTDEMVSQYMYTAGVPDPGPDHSHIGRIASEQFSDLAGGLFGMVHYSNLLAGFRQGGIPSCAHGLCPARSPLRRSLGRGNQQKQWLSVRSLRSP